MAVIFCDSSRPDDTGDGSTWALAKKTLQAAITAAGAGGTVYLADTHSETIAANYTITLPVSGNDPVKVITSDVLTGTSVSYVKASAAQIITTGGLYDIIFDGSGTFIGCSFSVVDDYIVAVTIGERVALIDCTLEYSNNSRFTTTGTDGSLYIRDTGFIFNQTSSSALAPIVFTTTEIAVEFVNNTFSFASGAATNFTGSVIGTGDNINLQCKDIDFSAFTEVDAVFTLDTNSPSHIFVDGCKIPSGVLIFDSVYFSDYRGVWATRCDGNNYGILHLSYWGELTDADKTRTGGASDGDAFAWKVVTTAACGLGESYFTQWMPVWIPATGSKTFTVYIGNASADLTDTECWLEVEYLGTASSTLPILATNRNADLLAAGTAHTDDTGSTWSGGGLTYMQSLAKTVTIAKAGLAQVRVAFVKPSATVYIDPLVTVS